jgi:glutathione S-transferase
MIKYLMFGESFLIISNPILSMNAVVSGPKIIGGAAFRTFRVLWMLEEMGVPYQHIPALPQSAQARRYNPLGKIPILVEEDGFVLYESSAIMTYLGDKHRGNESNTNPYPLVPLAGTKERGLYDQTMSVLLTELDAQGLWIHRKHEALGDFFTYIPDAVTHARKYFHKTNRTLIQQIKDNNGPFLLGSSFTAVDIVYVHCLQWSKSIGWNDKWKDDTVVTSYLDRCTSRPAFAKAKALRDAEKGSVDSNNFKQNMTRSQQSNI